MKEIRKLAMGGLLVLMVCFLTGCGSVPPPEAHVAQTVPPLSRPGDTGAEAAASLLEAALGGHTERIGVALDRGADANDPGGDGRTDLTLTAFGGHSEAVIAHTTGASVWG